MIEIKNEFLTACFNETGAELKSLVCDGKQYIFGGDPNIWDFSAPIMFPICGGLKDDKFCFEGEEYTLPKHGFAKFSLFSVEKKENDSVTFLLCADSQTKKQYPFDFKFRVIYTLENKKLVIKYSVENCGKGNMYFSVGAHEAYLCSEGIEEYDVVFQKTENFDSSVLHGNLLGDETVRVAENTDTIPLKYKYFEVDALVFKNIKSRAAVLKNRNTGKAVKVDFQGFDHFLLWTKPDAPYICLEPWCGIPDGVNAGDDITKKESIQTVAAGETYTAIHSIEIL